MDIIHKEEVVGFFSYSCLIINLVFGVYGTIWLFGTIRWFNRLDETTIPSASNEEIERNWFSDLRDKMLNQQRRVRKDENSYHFEERNPLLETVQVVIKG
eukprot:TRINITY_DN1013_c0_g1_i1.p1 TRINITY_DN1013_c0_g1~~TRINITY_DN1013_c0_g1_i1.p1  ORF type:complete len:100 (+),score=34.11 TRINITY_DN1013_c0_g1_i1:176-475(+)